jgi:hypothetical protein
MSNIIIPSVEQDKKEIDQYLKNASDSLTRISAEKDHIKTIIDELNEKFELPKKYIRKMIKLEHEMNVEMVESESNDLIELYKTIKGIE